MTKFLILDVVAFDMNISETILYIESVYQQIFKLVDIMIPVTEEWFGG